MQLTSQIGTVFSVFAINENFNFWEVYTNGDFLKIQNILTRDGKFMEFLYT